MQHCIQYLRWEISDLIQQSFVILHVELYAALMVKHPKCLGLKWIAEVNPQTHGSLGLKKKDNPHMLISLVSTKWRTLYWKVKGAFINILLMNMTKNIFNFQGFIYSEYGCDNPKLFTVHMPIWTFIVYKVKLF